MSIKLPYAHKSLNKELFLQKFTAQKASLSLNHLTPASAEKSENARK